jgi:hypothetical protein
MDDGYSIGMLLTVVRTEDGPSRVYATRHASIVTYFTETDDGGVALHAEPGFIAYPWDFVAWEKPVREAVLAEVASRLCIPVEDVARQPLAAIERVADPDLPEHYHYATRRRSRRSSVR